MTVRLVKGIVFSCLAFMLSGVAQAAPLSGGWALRVDGTTIYRFEISQTATGWNAVWARSRILHTQDGYTFSGLKGPVIRRVATKVTENGNVLELTFDDPRPGAIPDVFRITAMDDTHATEDYLGVTAEPVTLVREAADAPLGQWDSEKTYKATLDLPTNAEMTAIFNADQQDRKDWATHDPKAMAEADTKRRERTGVLIRTGALHSGEDFYHAAFVYQHGQSPDDYLLAHVLATVAVARGYANAIWISAATLDRYLMKTKQPQVFGTQTVIPNGGKPTQEPYNRDLIPDALRTVMNVPPLSQQAEVLRKRGGDDTPVPKP